MTYPELILARLKAGYYNSDPLSGANPGGLAGSGHVTNFPAALVDMGEVMEWLGQAAAVLDSPQAGVVGTSAFRNLLINGSMRLWQRYTTKTGLYTNYASDCWKIGGSGNDGHTVERSTDVPTGSGPYSLKVTATALNSPLKLSQGLELARGAVVGQRIAVSGMVKGPDAGTFHSRVMNIVGPNITVVGADWQPFETIFEVPVGHLPAQTDPVIEAIHSPSVGVWYVTDLQVAAAGIAAPPFERRPVGVELALAQRYFQTTYEPDVVAGTLTAAGQIIGTPGAATTAATTHMFVERFVVPMRAAPTVTLHSPVTASSAAARNLTDGTDVAAQLLSSSTRGLILRPVSNLVANKTYAIHYAAECF